MNRSIRSLFVLLLACAGGLGCDLRFHPRASSDAAALDDHSREDGEASSVRAPGLDEIDPCTELGVIVPRLSVELHAPRAGLLRGGGAELRAAGDLLYEIEAGDDVAALETQRAELDEAKATRERYAAEQIARARELRGAEQLGEHLADTEREAARDALTISARELHGADAQRRAAAARLEAQRARIAAGRLEAPFPGRIVRESVVPGAWVETGQALGRFVSTEDLVLRVALPAEQALRSPISARWRFVDHVGEPATAMLHPTHDDVDELSGLRVYEARIAAASLDNHPLGGSVEVELPTCHGHARGPER
ncbi:HlyD family efflux transporter periplasmic adaptor subunit [Enhygromyxa salina]|uniref:Uncharacterized protein n=1 Tax=Enhygromyxa salina TaxID=215803 RepID=A0A2S9YNL3_9BACT|nr:HlyD family efflux transporter periplasmic adaptor subunit [Enhygromyxa salina]PRQ06681.1 hypothetical protein ENSA7_35570 [Enhygromyxa salina]